MRDDFYPQSAVLTAPLGMPALSSFGHECLRGSIFFEYLAHSGTATEVAIGPRSQREHGQKSAREQHTTHKKSPARGKGIKDISKVRLVNKYIPSERILDLGSLDSSDVVVELEGLRTALAVSVCVYCLLL